MDYKKIYDETIRKSIDSNRIKSENSYFEGHHIIPKSLGGSNSKDNLVLLTAKEHYICHLLLMKIYENKDKKAYLKMCRAFNMMAVSNGKHKRYINSRTYEKFKNDMYGKNGLLTGENAPFFGKTFSDSTRQKISERQKNNNSMKGKKPWNYGLTKESNNILKESGNRISISKTGNTIHTQEHKDKISNKLKGKEKSPFSQEHKDKIALARSKQIITQEHKDKISQATKGTKKEKVKCPYCNKVGGKGSMGRWHFENCKEKI